RAREASGGGAEGGPTRLALDRELQGVAIRIAGHGTEAVARARGDTGRWRTREGRCAIGRRRSHYLQVEGGQCSGGCTVAHADDDAGGGPDIPRGGSAAQLTGRGRERRPGRLVLDRIGERVIVRIVAHGRERKSLADH